MKTYQAKRTDTGLELNTQKELADLYQTLEDEENFILTWKEDKHQKSELMLANNLTAKVRSGDIKLTAKEALK